jgi:hypothetical protein
MPFENDIRPFLPEVQQEVLLLERANFVRIPMEQGNSSPLILPIFILKFDAKLLMMWCRCSLKQYQQAR